MGLRDALKRTKAEITLAAEPLELHPGQDVRLQVDIGELDGKAQGARAGLRCTGSYLVRERDSDGDWEERWRSIVLHEELHELPLQAGAHEVTCTVPEGSAPTSEHAVKWTAWAVVDRRMGLDARAETELTVRSTADSLPAEAAPAAPGEGGLRFSEVPARAGMGTTIDGTLELTPESDLKTTGIVVRLARVRTYAENGSKVVKTDQRGEVELAGKAEYAAGQTTRLPFSIPVPADGPSVSVPHAEVQWVLTGTARRRLRGDHDVRAVIGIHS